MVTVKPSYKITKICSYFTPKTPFNTKKFRKEFKKNFQKIRDVLFTCRFAQHVCILPFCRRRNMKKFPVQQKSNRPPVTLSIQQTQHTSLPQFCKVMEHPMIMQPLKYFYKQNETRISFNLSPFPGTKLVLIAYRLQLVSLAVQLARQWQLQICLSLPRASAYFVLGSLFLIIKHYVYTYQQVCRISQIKLKFFNCRQGCSRSRETSQYHIWRRLGTNWWLELGLPTLEPKPHFSLIDALNSSNSQPKCLVVVH